MFEDFSKTLKLGGAGPSLEYLKQQFEQSGEYHKLFEILKMMVRQQMGLPLAFESQTQKLPEATERALEQGILDACRKVGTHLFRANRPQEGWMYLQPVGDRMLNRQLLRDVAIDEETKPTVIELAVGHRVDPAYGVAMMLEQSGVCDVITTIDVQTNQGQFTPEDRQAVCQTLLEYFYNQLLERVVDEVVTRQPLALSDRPNKTTLGELLTAHAWIVTETGHHVDATHLASVVRLSQDVSKPKHIQMARDLTAYGMRLSDDFHYRGEPPFESIFVDYQMWFDGRLGKSEAQVQAAIDFFTAKMDAAEEFDQPVVIETLVALLVKVNRHAAALEIALTRLTGKFEQRGIAPDLFEIANTPELKARLSTYFQAHDDLLGYAICHLPLADLQ